MRLYLDTNVVMDLGVFYYYVLLLQKISLQ